MSVGVGVALVVEVVVGSTVCVVREVLVVLDSVVREDVVRTVDVSSLVIVREVDVTGLAVVGTSFAVVATSASFVVVDLLLDKPGKSKTPRFDDFDSTPPFGVCVIKTMYFPSPVGINVIVNVPCAFVTVVVLMPSGRFLFLAVTGSAYRVIRDPGEADPLTVMALLLLTKVVSLTCGGGPCGETEDVGTSEIHRLVCVSKYLPDSAWQFS